MTDMTNPVAAVPAALMESVVRGWRDLSTRLVQVGRDRPEGGAGIFVNPPVTRGSTVLFSSLEAMDAAGQRRYDDELIYGAMGTPVQHRLEQAIAEIDGGRYGQIVPSGWRGARCRSWPMSARAITACCPIPCTAPPAASRTGCCAVSGWR